MVMQAHIRFVHSKAGLVQGPAPVLCPHEEQNHAVCFALGLTACNALLWVLVLHVLASASRCAACMARCWQGCGGHNLSGELLSHLK